ncbi:MAG: hypothetical protein EP330_23210 [Deltaproteobacteria bacterium]|nr:MAG: hypothetical protein EP330_23210 [Deltaproteobacteria bacterium]
MHRSIIPLTLLLAASPAFAAEVQVADTSLPDALDAIAGGTEATVILDTDSIAEVARRLLAGGHKLVDGRRLSSIDATGCVILATQQATRWTLDDNGRCAGDAAAFALAPEPSEAEPAATDAAVAEAPALEAAPPISESQVGDPVEPVPSPEASVAAAEPVPVREPAPQPPPAPTLPPAARQPEVAVGAGIQTPDRVSKFDGPADPGMIAFGLMYGTYAGAETGYLVGESLEEREEDHLYQGAVGGGIGGAIVGTSLGVMLAARRDYQPEEIGLLYSGSTLGAFYGAQFARAVIPVGADGDVERIHAASLAGSMAGVGLAILGADKAHGLGRQGGFALGTAVGWQTGAGFAAVLPPPPDRDRNGDGIAERIVPRRRDAALELTGALVYGGIASVANHAGIERPTPTTLALSLGHGAWIGAWSPVLFSETPTDRAIAGGLRLGTGVGYASAIGMAALGQPSPRAAAIQTAGWAAGSALGAGIPLSINDQAYGRQVVGPMLAGGVAGQVLGAVVAPAYDEFDANDAALLAVLESWTAYQALGWSLWASADGSRVPGRPIGYAMSAAGAGTLATLAISPRFDVSPAGSMALLSAGGWGTWAGMWGAQFAGAKTEGVWLTTLTTGNGAVLAAGLAQGLGWDPSWRHLGVVNGTGLIGTALGGLLGITVLYRDADWRPLIAATLSGSVLGLGAGAVLAARTKGPHVASLPELPGLRQVGLAAHVQAQPWMDEDGRPGAFLQVHLTETGK